MENLRTVRKTVTGKKAVDGAGVHLVRVIGHNDTKDFDPFLMLDAFDSENPDDYTAGFPWHPHRGIETITYLIQGNIEHGDSLGNKGTIRDGDCQWMTAGSGIIHQEMPKASKRMLGAQLWLNLPAKDKMTAPAYGDILNENIPVIEEGENKIHIVAGSYKGIKGAFEGSYVKPAYYDVEMKTGGELTVETEQDYTAFIYIVEGAAYLNPEDKQVYNEKQAVLFNPGSRIWIKAANQGVRFLFLCGKPLKEPVAWGGPIVMNTQEELGKAFEELDNNTFIKK
ncbi:MAG: pirin family protein [Clostridiaceae bacterium]